MSEKNVITERVERDTSMYLDSWSETKLDTIIERLQKAKEEFHAKYENVIDIFACVETSEYYGSVESTMVFTITRLETDAEFKKRIDAVEKQKKTAARNRSEKRKQKIAEEKETLRKLAKKHPKVLKELE